MIADPGPRLSISWVRGHRRSREMAVALGFEAVFVHAPGGPLPLRYLRQWRATRRLLRQRRPSAVMVMQPPPLALWAVRGYARRRGVPLLGDLHSGVFLDPKWRWAAGSVLRTLRRRGAAIVPNQELAERCAAAGVPAFVIPAFIEPLAPAPEGPVADVATVLVPLTYSRDEPIDALLGAAAAAPELRWQFTGRAPQAVRDRAPANVEFVGFVDDAAFLALRRGASAVAAITTVEGTMQSAGYEALAAATPLLTVPTRVLRAYFGDAARYAAPVAAELAAGARELVADAEGWSRRMRLLRDRVLDDQERAASRARRWLSARLEGDPFGALEGRRVLFVASTGGHLAQLVRLSRRAEVAPDSSWVTFDSPQSRSLLEGRRVTVLPYIAPRDLFGTIRATGLLRRALAGQRYDVVVSTGAAIALAGFWWALGRRVRRVYVESFSRVQGPSLTGRIVAATRIAERFTQHPLWNRRGWRPFTGVLAGFRSAPRDPAPAGGRPLRLLVTLGTIRPYRFGALLEAVLATGAVAEDSVWQLGATEDPGGLPGRVVEQLPAEEFDRLAAAADAVVTHAGVGTVLQLLELGVHPVMVPRRSARAEHVDDHQEQIAAYIAGTGLGSAVEVSQLDAAVLRRAAASRVIPDPAE